MSQRRRAFALAETHGVLQVLHAAVDEHLDERVLGLTHGKESAGEYGMAVEYLLNMADRHDVALPAEVLHVIAGWLNDPDSVGFFPPGTRLDPLIASVARRLIIAGHAYP